MTNSSIFISDDRVAVLFPLPLDRTYDYRVPNGMSLTLGDFVVAPLGKRQEVGVVWGIGCNSIPKTRLKDIIDCRFAPPIPETMRRFVDWVAYYTLSRLGAVLKMVISVPNALESPKSVNTYALSTSTLPNNFRLTKARRKVLETLKNNSSLRATELARKAGVSVSVITSLARTGALAITPSPLPFDKPNYIYVKPHFSKSQAIVVRALRKSIGNGYTAIVLDGVPGSGKTEVYFEAIAKALSLNQQVLVMLPEIALSSQWLKRFQKHFGVSPAVWHSDLTRATRRTTWRAVATGQAHVVVGARSSLFLPFPNLGLIIVDEEHDSSFKQEESVIYNGRDMAVTRAYLQKIPILLVSATPSLETVVNVENGRYRSLHLPERHGGAIMPKIDVIDLRKHPPPRNHWLSPPLVAAIEETLQRREQVMLFLNRRGYAPLTLCRQCGHRIKCPSCSAWLVEHRSIGCLQCHYCGFRRQILELCPHCGATNSLTACGPGVERMTEEAIRLFPNARWALAASDTLVTPRMAADLVARLEQREVDLLIGTQIIAKGYHFPYLTLVGAIDADLSLAGGDLRAAERTYQLLYQVAGRAGRAKRPGRVFLQTAMPEHPVMTALAHGERDRFLEIETATRKAANMPPFGRLVSLIVSGTDDSIVETTSRNLARCAPRGQDLSVLGPAPAPLALLRGRHRRRLLLRTSKKTNVQHVVRQWLAHSIIPRSIRIQIDVDPYSFF